jgi:hypothetical protein
VKKGLVLAEVTADHDGWEREAERIEGDVRRISKRLGEGYLVFKRYSACGTVERKVFTTMSPRLHQEFQVSLLFPQASARRFPM